MIADLSKIVDHGVSHTFTTETHMFSHIMIGARDLDTMVAFYDAVLPKLDLRRVVELDDVDEAGVIWRNATGVGRSSPSGAR